MAPILPYLYVILVTCYGLKSFMPLKVNKLQAVPYIYDFKEKTGYSSNWFDTIICDLRKI